MEELLKLLKLLTMWNCAYLYFCLFYKGTLKLLAKLSEQPF